MRLGTSLVLSSLVIAGSIAVWQRADQIPVELRNYFPWANDSEPEHAAGHDHEMHEDELPSGRHGGKLLDEGPFSLEITIAETGHPPEFRVYAHWDGEPLAPADVQLRIVTTRLGGTIEQFDFAPRGDYLRGSASVGKPHSFDIEVMAEYAGGSYRWSYENHEGRVHIPQAQAEQSGIATETSGATTIHEKLILTGRVQTDPNRLSRVRPRFPGVVKSVRRNLGDVVAAGAVLATVQSNESLQTYSLTAPIGGLIVRRDVQVGETTADEALFVIADLSRVWVELDVFGRDLPSVRAGQTVEIETFDNYRIAGKIDWISPLAAHASQSVSARVPLANAEGRLRPGQFVRGHVMIAEYAVPLAVRKSALQRFRDFEVVFARFGETYEVRIPDLGRRDSDWVEVLGGLAPGTEYVTANSYLIKADIEKSGASHDH